MAGFLRTVAAFGMLGALALLLGVGGPTTAKSQDRAGNKQNKNVPDAKLDLDLSKFMRRKLEASDQILEGLVTEDSELVLKGAKILVEMSGAEKWHVRNDVIYKQHSNDFQQSAKKLVEAAEKENFDAVALKWIDTTMKCVECHKFVRGARLANAGK